MAAGVCLLFVVLGSFVTRTGSHQTQLKTASNKLNVRRYEDYTFEGALNRAQEECSYMSLVNDTSVRARRLEIIKEKITTKRLKEFYEMKEKEKQKAKEFYEKVEEQSRRRILEEDSPLWSPEFLPPRPFPPPILPLSPPRSLPSPPPSQSLPQPLPSPKSLPQPLPPPKSLPQPLPPSRSHPQPLPPPKSLPQPLPPSRSHPQPLPPPKSLPQPPPPPRGLPPRHFYKRSSDSQGRRRKTSTPFSEVSFTDHNNCSSRCLFARMEMVDGNGFPEESLITKLIEDKITNKNVRLVKTKKVNSCFKKMEEVAYDDSCIFSSRLFDCLNLAEFSSGSR